MSLFLLFLSIYIAPFVSPRPSQDMTLSEMQSNIKDGKIFMYGTTLAGWLVADYTFTENSPAWKNVSVETAKAGEYATMKYLGRKKGNDQFKSHRENFYTEQDFADIASAGLNVVRIPVGYWILGHDNSGRVYNPYAWKMYAKGVIGYLDKAIKVWAPKYNILVIIVMQAAKGSQNGYGSSAPVEPGSSNWWRYRENINNTLDTVEFLAKHYSNDHAFLGIALLNEPVNEQEYVAHGMTPNGILKQYYYDAYGRVRHDASSNCLLLISPLLHEQGNEEGEWETFMMFADDPEDPAKDSFDNIRVEWHPYYLSDPTNYTVDEILKEAVLYKNRIQLWEGNPLFIGDWNLDSAVNMTKGQLKRFGKIQMDSYSISPVRGWSFGAWKHYGDDEKLDKYAPRSTIEGGRRSMKAMLRSRILPYLA